MLIKILNELTNQYGRAEYDMDVVYKHLIQQKFPPLGQQLTMITALREHRTNSAESVLKNQGNSPPILRQYPAFKFLTNSMHRRNSTIGRLLGKTDSPENNINAGKENRARSWVTRRIKRPIDFRFSGAPICSFFRNIEDLISVYLAILSEKRLIVVSSQLR